MAAPNQEPDDTRLRAARYAVERDAPDDDDEPVDRGAPTLDERAQAVEIAVQQAIRRGDFDDLPGAGKPIQDLGRVRDENWWIRRKIERENLTGLGPPAFTLRTEDRGLEDRLDALHAEQAVRDVLEDFNRRVRLARLQLQGGPPVVTRYRDVEAEVLAWRERALARRDAQERAQREEREREAAALAAMTWRERRRARRGR